MAKDKTTDEFVSKDEAKEQKGLPGVAGDTTDPEKEALKAENDALKAENSSIRQDVDLLKRAVLGQTVQTGAAAGEATKGSETFINDTRDALKKQRHYKISIPSTETQKDPIHVAINGYAYNIPRDTEVSLPESVIEVLRNAKYTVYTLKKRGEGEEGNELVGQDVQRFPFQSVGN